MTIAIDFDDTITRDPGMWAQFIKDARQKKHTVIICTGRSDAGAYGCEVRRFCDTHLVFNLPIVFAGKDWKRHASAEAGYEVDVWIDDAPEYIGPQTLILNTGKGPV